MIYLYLKALHIIALVCWFAGLFYIGRLYVYNVEANDKPELERKILKAQFTLMQRRLWFGITWPSMVLTVIAGTWLMILTGAYLEPWFHVKLVFVVGLISYHFYCGFVRRKLDAGRTYTSMHMRILNEVPVVFLIAIVFIVSVKSYLNLVTLAEVIGVLILLMAGGMLLYRQKRLKNPPGGAH